MYSAGSVQMSRDKGCVTRSDFHVLGSQRHSNLQSSMNHESSSGLSKEETTKEEIYKAINQLTSLVIGGRFARATKQYQKNPKERIEHCYQLTISEQKEAFGDFNKKNQVQRKVDSLYSLNLLAQLANEVEWD